MIDPHLIGFLGFKSTAGVFVAGAAAGVFDPGAAADVSPSAPNTSCYEK